MIACVRTGVPLLFLLFLLMWTSAHAQQDITPPSLLDVQFDPQSVDTSKSLATLIVTATFSDDLSGFHDAFIVFAPISGTTQSHSVGFGHVWDSDTEEGLLFGVYSDAMTMPRYAAQGWWAIEQLSLVDMVGNRKDYFESSTDGFPEILKTYRFYNGTEEWHQFDHRVFIPSVLVN